MPLMDLHEARAWLTLTLTPSVSQSAQRKLLAAFGMPQQVLDTSEYALAEQVGNKPARALLQANPERDALIEKTLLWLDHERHHIMTLGDVDFPQALLMVADPPPILYINGKRELLRSPMLAVVGSRNASPQGLRDATAFSQVLANAGLTIISGLALGIDAAAHRGGLDGAGSSVAVVGTGADRIYPTANEPLAREMAAKGAILSEFPLGTPPLRENFPRRNRIISGLAKGVLVVEAAPQSGSLITARLAGEQGREVFAIPGSIHSPFSKGCHALIKQGAKLVESAEDVLSELTWEGKAVPLALPLQLPPKAPTRKSRAKTAEPAATTADSNAAGAQPAATSIEQALLDALGHAPVSVDQLAIAMNISTAELLATLTTLELEGQVAALPGGRFQRIT